MIKLESMKKEDIERMLEDFDLNGEPTRIDVIQLNSDIKYSMVVNEDKKVISMVKLKKEDPMENVTLGGEKEPHEHEFKEI